VFGCGFVQMYGMTETAGAIVALPPEDHETESGARLASVGRPLPGVELRILDPAGQPLPAGEIGEIATRSLANMTGYYNLPKATAATIDGEGWLHTGDAGYLDADGYLFLTASGLIISAARTFRRRSRTRLRPTDAEVGG
jgi:acyl-CoA synthetase (AMP-forming)/AMP-acid ligase II